MREWIKGRQPLTAIERTIGIGRSGPNPDIGSQVEDLRVHVLRCERWARFDDRLDLSTLLDNAHRGARTAP